MSFSSLLSHTQPPLKQRLLRHALWSAPFRSLFLCGALLAVTAIALWLMPLVTQHSLHLPLSPAFSALFWHAHEMLFGFGGAAAAGFLLTASKHWCEPSPHSKWPSARYLVVLTLVWLCARVGFFIQNNELAYFISFAAQLTWWVMVLLHLAKLLILSRSTQFNQRLFITMLVFGAIATMNMLVFMVNAFGQKATVLSLFEATVLLYCLLMGVILSRVLPFFTNSALGTTAIANQRTGLNGAIIVASVVGLSGFLLNRFTSLPIQPGWLMALVGLLHLLRIAMWLRMAVWQHPLLWILYVAYFGMASGLIAIGVSELTQFIAFADALHLITISGMSTLILAMMMRVSLGHTGRPLLLDFPNVVTFILLFTAGIVRFYAGIATHTVPLLIISGLLFTAAFTAFLVRFCKLLLLPRRSDKST